MNLVFRMIRVIVAALLARGATPDARATLTLSFRVWPNDLDTNLHMNNGRYLTLMDLGRLDLIIRTGLHRVLRARKWYPVVGAAHVVYRRSLDPFERFTMETRLLGWDEDWIYLRQDMIKGDGRLAARAIFKTVFLHRGKRIPSADLAEAFGLPAQSPPLPDAITTAFPEIL